MKTWVISLKVAKTQMSTSVKLLGPSSIYFKNEIHSMPFLSFLLSFLFVLSDFTLLLWRKLAFENSSMRTWCVLEFEINILRILCYCHTIRRWQCSAANTERKTYTDRRQTVWDNERFGSTGRQGWSASWTDSDATRSLVNYQSDTPAHCFLSIGKNSHSCRQVNLGFHH